MRGFAGLALLLCALQAPAQTCVPEPLPGTTLYLRGSMTSWAALEEYAFQYRCDAYYLNVELKAREEFKVADADWSPATSFGASEGEALVAGGPNAVRQFGGEHTLRLVIADGRARLTVGPRTFAGPKAREVTDPAALGLRFDSRAPHHKAPFGAVTTGTMVRFAVDAPAGVDGIALVVETRRLEGNQEKLQYAEVARVPMTARKQRSGAVWQARYRFAAKGVYGYWFEARIGDQRYVIQNNNATVAWTRERGSGGMATVAFAPDSVGRIRRFRQTVFDPRFEVPAWAGDAVYYQIFPDRFRNGDARNDPQPGRDLHHAGTVELHANWLDKPWRPGSGDGSDNAYNNDFFGGDLAGIVDKLGALQDLGVNTLYLTPIFRAASNHKYDTADYRHVDPALGSDADFAHLVKAAARHGMRVIPDASFNHTGSDSVYFDRFGNHPGVGAFEGGEIRGDSPYARWYRFDAAQSDPARRYKGWGGPDLPEVDESAPSFRAFAFGARDSVTRLWLDRGAAGWRMDVVPWVPDDFWRDWRRAVKAQRSDAIAIAETWFDASKYFLGDMFDATMNYVFRNAVLDFAAGGRAQDLAAQLEHLREAYPPQALHASMNLIGSHDVARALHVLGWQDEKADARAIALAKQRLRLAAFIQMTQPGAPMIYYGDEVGMTGGDDPYNRATYPWPDLGGRPDLELRAGYRRLIRMRHDHALLRRAAASAPVHVDDHTVVWLRERGRERALVAINNATMPRTLTLPWPGGRTAPLHDALTGAVVRPTNRRLTITVPPLFGTVLLSRP